MSHTVQLCHDQQACTVTLSLHYDNAPEAVLAYLNLFANLADKHHALVVAEAPSYGTECRHEHFAASSLQTVKAA